MYVLCASRRQEIRLRAELDDLSNKIVAFKKQVPAASGSHELLSAEDRFVSQQVEGQLEACRDSRREYMELLEVH